MKRWAIGLIAFFILTTGNVAYVGANSSLVLSGSVVDIGVGCAHEKPYAAVGLLMQFYNAGSEPVIVLSPNNYYFQGRVVFSSTGGDEKGITGNVLTFNPYLDDPFGIPTIYDYDPLPGYISTMRGIARSENSVPASGWLIIEPGRYHEFRTGVMIRNGFRFETISAKKPEKCDPKNFKVYPEHESFRVEYFFSLKKYEGGEGLFSALRDAWKRHGNLVLNNSGDVSYRAEPILIHNDKQDK